MQLAQLLATHLTEQQMVEVYAPAEKARTLAGLCYAKRMEAVSALDAAVQDRGWRSPQVAEAIRSAHCDDALLRYRARDFILASGGGHDLDLSYPGLAPGLSHALQEKQITQALSFLDKVRPIASDDEAWIEALKLEAMAYLYQLQGDWHLELALEQLAVVEQTLLNEVAGRDPFDPQALQSHAAIVQMYRRLGVPWRVEDAYRRFCAGFGEPDIVAAWKARIGSGLAFPSQAVQSFLDLVNGALDTLTLANPSDLSEWDQLRSLVPLAFVPLVLAPDRLVVNLPALPPEDYVQADEALEQITKALPQQASRARAVLRAWQAVARLGRLDFSGIVEVLAPLVADEEALGIAVHALEGEARYRLGDYEDAYLDLLKAESLARAVLARVSPDPLDWQPAERDALSRLAQKAGNALLAIGDEAKADEAYARARALMPDEPKARAGALINQGNLAYQRNNLVDQQGYVTLDGELRQRMAVEGPAILQTAKMGWHVASLDQAARLYREALELLAGLSDTDDYARELAAIAHVNLGNTAWAWGRALEAEGVKRLDQLPLPSDWQPMLVQAGADRAECYRIAIAHQQKALAIEQRLQRRDASLAATANSNLSELWYLLGKHTKDRADWERGIEAATQALALLGPNTSALVPELVWRTAFNLARLHGALGELEQAWSYYEQAIDAVEKLRANLRLDAWQATFLQDRLEAYEGAIRFLFRQGPQQNIERIFELVERTKARAFLDLLDSARLPVGLPADLARRRAEILAQIAYCNDQIRQALQADDQERATELLGRQREYALSWTDLQVQVLEAQQTDEDLSPELASLAEVQAALGQDRVILSFLLGQRDSYLLVIDGQGARAFQLANRLILEQAALPVIHYASHSSVETYREFRKANEALVDLLFGPLDKASGLVAYLAGKHVIIAPDGILYYLPFEALLVDRSSLAILGEAERYPAFQPYYLISHADVSYVPSASAWMHLARRPVRNSQASLLAAYNIQYEGEGIARPAWAMRVLLKLPNLPNARAVLRAAESIQNRWPAEPVVHVRARQPNNQPESPANQSTEENFLRIAGANRPRFLLFDGHGIYNDKVPNFSGLVFNLESADGGSGDDASSVVPGEGFLRVEELFQLDLSSTELAFLAACQTGLGQVYRGEGINALTRAFMYRGSPAVVASLWAVSDQITSILVRRFFALIAEQPNADRAHLLCEVRRSVCQSETYASPYYWAPFVLNGVSTPPLRD